MTNIPLPFSDDQNFDHLIQDKNFLATGTTRKVYRLVYPYNDKVIKVSINKSNNSNWSEYILYNKSDLKNLLGEVFSISNSGKYLIMEYLSDTTESERKNANFPSWWTDRKPSNIGKCCEFIKIRDYASFKLTNEVAEKNSGDTAKITQMLHDLKSIAGDN